MVPHAIEFVGARHMIALGKSHLPSNFTERALYEPFKNSSNVFTVLHNSNMDWHEVVQMSVNIYTTNNLP